jgi:hypothetical protein
MATPTPTDTLSKRKASMATDDGTAMPENPLIKYVEERLYAALDSYAVECVSNGNAGDDDPMPEIDGKISLDPLTNVMKAKLSNCEEVHDYRALSSALADCVPGYTVILKDVVNNVTNKPMKIVFVAPNKKRIPDRIDPTIKTGRGLCSRCFCCLFKLSILLAVLFLLIPVIILVYSMLRGDITLLVTNDGVRHWFVSKNSTATLPGA